jgi:hypothetical protein
MKPNISARWVLVGVQVLLVEVCHGSGHVVRLVIRTSDAGRCRGASEMASVDGGPPQNQDKNLRWYIACSGVVDRTADVAILVDRTGSCVTYLKTPRNDLE